MKWPSEILAEGFRKRFPAFPEMLREMDKTLQARGFPENSVWMLFYPPVVFTLVFIWQVAWDKFFQPLDGRLVVLALILIFFDFCLLMPAVRKWLRQGLAGLAWKSGRYAGEQRLQALLEKSEKVKSVGEAREVYLADLKTADLQKNAGGRAEAQLCLASVELKDGNLELARQYLDGAEFWFRNSGRAFGYIVALCCRGSLELKKGGLEQARQAFSKALDLGLKHGSRPGQARAESGLGEAERVAGNFQAARAHLAASRDLWEGVGDTQNLAQTLMVLAGLSGDESEQEDLLEKARSLFSRRMNRMGLASACYRLGCLEAARGSAQAARKHLDEALDYFHKVVDEEHEAETLLEIGSVEAAAGRTEEAATQFLESARLFGRAKNGLGQGKALQSQALAERERKNDAAALPLLESAAALFQKASSADKEAKARLDLAEIQIHAGDLAGARKNLLRAGVLWEGLKDRGGEATAHIRLAELETLAGALDAARRHLETARSLSQFLHDEEAVLRLFFLQAETEKRAGNGQEVRRIMEQARETCHNRGDLKGEGQAVFQLGEASHLNLNPGGAIRFYQESRSLFMLAGFEPGVAQTFRREADMEALEGNLNEAARCYGEAAAVYRRIQDGGSAAEMEEKLARCREQGRAV